MQAYAIPTPKVPALSRTWQARVTYRECGVVTDIHTYTITISNLKGEPTAEIDGRPAGVLDAARILSNAKSENGLTLTRELLPFPANMARCLGVSV